MTREEAKKRTELLKSLREQHAETVERTQALLKEGKKTQQLICQTIRSEPHTVPEIAQTTGLPAYQVLWFITALKKYGLLRETGNCGDYYLYQMNMETKQ